MHQIHGDSSRSLVFGSRNYKCKLPQKRDGDRDLQGGFSESRRSNVDSRSRLGFEERFRERLGFDRALVRFDTERKGAAPPKGITVCRL